MSVSVPIEFLAKFEKALDGFDDFSKKINTKVDSVESKFSGLSNILKFAAAAFTVKKIIDGLQAVVKEAAEAEEVTNKLANSLKAAGDFSQQNVQAFEDLADQLARTTRFTDEQVKSQVAIAKQFGLTNKEAAKLIRVSTDLAEVTGQDLDQVTRQLGQTFDGTAGRLAQLFPELQKLTAEELRNGAAVDILGAKYENFAGGALNTFTGSLGQVFKAFGDISESLGNYIVKNRVVIQLFKEFTYVLQDVRSSVDSGQGTFIDLFNSAIFASLNGIKFFVQAVAFAERALLNFLNAGSLVTKTLAALTANFNSPRKALKDLKDAFADFNNARDRIGERTGAYKAFDETVDGLIDRLGQAAKKNNEIAKSTDNVSKGFDNQTTAVQRFNTEIKTDFEQLEKSLRSQGATAIDTLNNTYAANIRILDKAKKSGFITNERYINTLGRLTLKYEEEAAQLRKKSYDEVLAQVREIAANPIQFFLGTDKKRNADGTFGRLGLSEANQGQIAAGGGLLQSILGGAEGAKKFIGSAATAAGVAFFGPAGEILGPIAEALSAGPEAVRAQVQAFAKALPDLIQALIEAVPVLVEELAVQAPKILERLIERAPEIIENIIRALPRVIVALIALLPRMIGALVKGAGRFTLEILRGAGRFVENILDGALKFVGKIISGAGQFIKELIKGIGNAPGNFLSGITGGRGSIIPGVNIIPDNIPIIGGLFKGGGGADLGPRRASSFSKSGGSGQIAVSVQISRNQLANTIIDLNRFGYRLEPV